MRRPHSRLMACLMALTGFMAASPAYAVMEDYPSVKLQGLDKSVGRTVTFEARVGSTIQYGPLFIKIHACRKAPPIETPESAAFLQIWEVPPGEQKSEWVFSGWMFASSPALSAMDHPVYDVWVLDCIGREEPNEEAKAAETKEEADQTNLPAADGEASAPATGEQEIPTDSEAEPEEAPATTSPQLPAQGGVLPDPALPSQDTVYPTEGNAAPIMNESGFPPAAAPSPDAAYYQYQTAPSVPPSATQTAPPADERGVTAYDLLPPQNIGNPPASR